MGCTVAVLFTAVALILWVPAADSRAYDRLSKVKVGKSEWDGASPEVIYADLCDRLLQKGEGHSIVFVEGIDLRDRTISWQLDEDTTAVEHARHLAELSGYKLYTTKDRLLIDYEGKDHRTWLKKAQDWLRGLPGQFSNEPPDPFLPAGHRPSYSL